MCPAIDNPPRCEIHTVLHFLRAKNMNAVEIHHELCVVYDQNVMSERTIRQWLERSRMGEQIFTIKSKVICSECMIFFKVLNKTFVKDSAQQFQNFHGHFHKFNALFST
jgi:hypothetical protein